MNRDAPVCIRTMTVADLDQVLEIAAGLPQAPHWPREAYERALEQLRKPERIPYVAEIAGGLVIGFCIAVVVGSEAEIETLAVAPASQKRGVARLLLQVLFAKLKRMSVTEVMLEVRESNQAARSLYASLGFGPSGRRRRYYSDPEEDALVLRLALG